VTSEGIDISWQYSTCLKWGYPDSIKLLDMPAGQWDIAGINLGRSLVGARPTSGSGANHHSTWRPFGLRMAEASTSQRQAGIIGPAEMLCYALLQVAGLLAENYLRDVTSKELMLGSSMQQRTQAGCTCTPLDGSDFDVSPPCLPACLPASLLSVAPDHATLLHLLFMGASCLVSGVLGPISGSTTRHQATIISTA
jgi:hypothetical protein